jgi:hypothetical protein
LRTKQFDLTAAPARAHQHLAAGLVGLDAVAHRVLHQGLQQQRRQAGAVERRVELPTQAQALAEAQRLDVEVAARQHHLLAQGAGPVGGGERGAEQLGQVLEHALGLRRVQAHQGHGGVQGVEEEMRADARLQFGIACVQPGRALGAHAQAQPDQQRPGRPPARR